MGKTSRRHARKAIKFVTARAATSKGWASKVVKPSGLKPNSGKLVKISATVTKSSPAVSTRPSPKSDLASRLVASIDRRDANDIDVLVKYFQIKRDDLARLTGFSLRALADWSKGQVPSEPARRRLAEIRRLLEALTEIVKVDAVPKWLHSRNTAFDEMTPLQVIEVGEIDRLWQMVYRMGSNYID